MRVPALTTYTDTAPGLHHRLRWARFMSAPAGTEGAGAPAPAETAPPAGGEQPATDPPAPQDPPKPGPPADDPKAETVESLPTWAQRTIAELREENGRSRVNAKETAAQEARQELLSTLTQALGGGEQGQEQAPTVESLTARLTEQQQTVTQAEQTAEQAQADAKEARAEATVVRVAYRAGIDGDGLLDSRKFLSTLKDVDTADREAVEKHVKEYAEANPRFLTRAVGASSVDPSAGSAVPRTRTPMSIADAAAADLARGTR